MYNQASSAAIDEALNNFQALHKNAYPGRGIVVGLDSTWGNIIMMCWTMGRKENSRNRVMVTDTEGLVSTKPADPSKVKDPSLIIYSAMREVGPYFIVSNGNQTDTVYNKVMADETCLKCILNDREYEPDAPINTQRITALCSINRRGEPIIEMSILRKSPFAHECDSVTYRYGNVPAGLGYCITTYAADGEPPPRFEGEPLLMPLMCNAEKRADVERLAEQYWKALNKENRVSLAIKWIDIATLRSETHVINKYKQVS